MEYRDDGMLIEKGSKYREESEQLLRSYLDFRSNKITDDDFLKQLIPIVKGVFYDLAQSASASTGEAQDACNRTIYHIYNKLKTYPKPIQNIRAFIYTTVYHKFLDWVRNSKNNLENDFPEGFDPPDPNPPSMNGNLNSDQYETPDVFVDIARDILPVKERIAFLYDILGPMESGIIKENSFETDTAYRNALSRAIMKVNAAFGEKYVAHKTR